MQIDRAIAMVTGGGSGLGEAVAARLADGGASVAVVDVNEAAVEKVAERIKGIGIAADVSDAPSISTAIDKIAAVYGEPPRIVVSCAGIGTGARILPRDGSLTIDAFEQTIRVNLIGTYIVLSVAARAMAKLLPLDDDGSRGVFVNTASVAFEDGQIGQAAYAASKGGIASLTLPAARELARVGIRVVAVAPGLFETPMSEGLADEVRAELIANIPFPQRMGRADEFARLVTHVVENQMLNGTTIRLDGAVRLPRK